MFNNCYAEAQPSQAATGLKVTDVWTQVHDSDFSSSEFDDDAIEVRPLENSVFSDPTGTDGDVPDLLSNNTKKPLQKVVEVDEDVQPSETESDQSYTKGDFQIGMPIGALRNFNELDVMGHVERDGTGTPHL